MTNGNKYIIVAMNYLTKWPEAQAVSNANAEATANFLYETIICQYEYPQKILSDCGTHFKNQMVEKLMQKFLKRLIWVLLVKSVGKMFLCK